MKKRPWMILYIALCLLVCLIPLFFMPWFSARDTIGNESKVPLPSLSSEEGSVNIDYLSDLGNYFEHHYAFRPQLITADAALQANVFSVSNTDSVITGKDGWLFYRSTLNDFMGEGTLSERSQYNLAHNLSIIQDYVTSQGAKFLFLAPPNKNSLYPQFMPYYFKAPEEAEHNRDLLPAQLEQQGISWINLQSLFEAQEDILYLKQDSHWGNRGAILVAEEIFQKLLRPHTDYASVTPQYIPSHAGDLARMLYPASQALEAEEVYDLPVKFTYIPNPASSDPVSVEDFRIETTNPEGTGSLLMYRDSFGNTLLPLMANEFAHGYYSKGIPYSIARDMTVYEPDVVIIELVERNLRNLAQNPAIFPAPMVTLQPEELREIKGIEISAETCMADTSYYQFRGVLPEDGTEEAPVYLGFTMDGEEVLREAFLISDADTDYAFLAYLPASQFESLEQAQQAEVKVFLGK